MAILDNYDRITTLDNAAKNPPVYGSAFTYVGTEKLAHDCILKATKFENTTR